MKPSGKCDVWYSARNVAKWQKRRHEKSGVCLLRRDGKTIPGLSVARGDLAPADIVRVWDAVGAGVVDYGFSISIKALEPPQTGTFNGLEIVLSPFNPLELQCFLLLHLFGHSVQWTAPSFRPTIESFESSLDLETFLQLLRRYESEAAQLGLQLLHQVGVTDCDQWFANFAATDWRYVERYYREGAIPPLTECRVTCAPLVEPKAIPPLEHRWVDVRFAF
jgi:hypothetical protein